MGILLSMFFPPRPAIVFNHQLYRDPVEWDELTEEMVDFPSTRVPDHPKRHLSIWTPKNPRGIVLFCHGMHEHG